MTEPSLLDFVTAKLRFWRRQPDGLPSLRRLWLDNESREHGSADAESTAKDESSARRFRIPTIRLQGGDGPPPMAVASALVLTLVGLAMIGGPDPHVAVATVLFGGAVGAVFFAVRLGEIPQPDASETADAAATDPRFRPALVCAAAVACIVTGVSAAGNRAGPGLFLAWIAAVALAAGATTTSPGDGRRAWRAIRARIDRKQWSFNLPRFAMLPVLLVVGALIVRTRALAVIPTEMVSFHAEFILSVLRAGQPDPPIVFPWGSGGLEPIPVYLEAVLAPLVGGLSFMSFKLGTLLAGLATLPLIYLLGVELGGRPTGVAGTALAAVGFWPDLVSRTGLSDGWYPPFAAAALLLLVRGVRLARRLDFAAAGVVIGLAIQTTSFARSLTALAVVVVGAAWFPAGPEQRRKLLAGLGVVLILAVIAGLPTLVAARSAPVDGGALWWLGAANGARDHGIASGLVERFARAVAMPLWSDGPVWVHGGGMRPALDRVAGAFLVLGTALAIVGVVLRRRLVDALFLLSVPLLVLPAVLAPLDPAMAPSPVRCGGAMAPVFVLAGAGFASAIGALARSIGSPLGRRVAVAAAIGAVALSALAGRSVVRGTFAETWDRSAWNASELGGVVRGAVAIGVPLERARVVPHPHWVDTRLVGAEAGHPKSDLAIDPQAVRNAAGRAGPQLYLLHPDDHRTLRTLKERLPSAAVIRFESRTGNRPFLAVIDLTTNGGE
jgi:hypothetical protein